MKEHLITVELASRFGMVESIGDLILYLSAGYDDWDMLLVCRKAEAQEVVVWLVFSQVSCTWY